MIETEILLCAISYRITFADEWTVIFTESIPINSRPTKFMFHRTATTIWYVELVDSWGDRMPAHHVSEAYQWLLARVGGDHDLIRLPPAAPVYPHAWKFNPQLRSTFCTLCDKEMSDLTRFRSCSAAARTAPT